MKHLPVFAFLCGSLAAQSLAILPNNIELNGPEARQQLIAEAASGRYNEDCTHKAKWTSANPQIATVDEHGLVRPAGDGETTITAAANGAAASVRVVVKNSHAPFTWSFKNHVIPVLTKMGCNQGACHGALAGKNGFKLTLRGYDPDVDYDTLTRQAAARRVSLADPPTASSSSNPPSPSPTAAASGLRKDRLNTASSRSGSRPEPLRLPPTNPMSSASKSFRNRPSSRPEPNSSFRSAPNTRTATSRTSPAG